MPVSGTLRITVVRGHHMSNDHARLHDHAFTCREVDYRQVTADALGKAGPGGHSGASTSSSAADLTPVIGSSDKPLPGPADPTLRPGAKARKPVGPRAGATARGAPEVST